MWNIRGHGESSLKEKEKWIPFNKRWGGEGFALPSLLWISPAKSEPWPPRQRSNCILKLWFVPKKWLNFYHFLLTTGMYFTYSHLYSERRDVLGVFPIQKKKLWAAFCCDVRKNRLWIPLQKHHRKHAGGGKRACDRNPWMISAPDTSQQPVLKI